MSSETEDSANESRVIRYLEKFSRKYLPVVGACSHTAFAVHILNRGLLPGFFPNWHLGVANSLLFNSHLGIGLYIYTRPSLSRVCYHKRILWSVYGSALFNFGSVLLLGTGKQILSEDRVIGILYAISTSLVLLVIGKQYLDFVDENID